MGTDDLFVDNPMIEPLGDEETPIDQVKLVGDEARSLKDGEDPVV